MLPAASMLAGRIPAAPSSRGARMRAGPSRKKPNEASSTPPRILHSSGSSTVRARVAKEVRRVEKHRPTRDHHESPGSAAGQNPRPAGWRKESRSGFSSPEPTPRTSARYAQPMPAERMIQTRSARNPISPVPREGAGGARGHRHSRRCRELRPCPLTSGFPAARRRAAARAALPSASRGREPPGRRRPC